MRAPVRLFLWILAVGVFVLLSGDPVVAQDAKPEVKQDSKEEAKKDSKEDTKQDSKQDVRSRRRGSFRGGPSGEMPFGVPPGGFPMPGAMGKPGDSTDKPGDGSGAVQRPKMPLMPPRPGELRVMPDEKGKVRFNFNGQPWPGVLEWLARVSQMSLDWQELPDGFLNLNTQRSYTVAEARDLINVHLLARGFTILRQGELLHVVNIKKLDPSLVPRVAPTELDRRDPHEFVKVSFALDWLMATVAVEEFEPMLSPNGKLKALEKTNRIEAMDAVVNLREIYSVLKAEQSGDSKKSLVREFILHHARASDVQAQLQTLLDIPQKSAMPAAPQSPDQAQQQAMMMAQMQMQMQGGGRGRRGRSEGQPGQPPGSAAQGKASAITLVVDDRRNSILAHAPPDSMAIIAQAIDAIDVPSDRSQTLVGNMSRMQVYRLVGVDPEPVVKTLQQMGNLDPTTRLDIDPRNKAIIAYASLADHVTIRAVVAKLSGSERSFAVRRLRPSHAADYVAGTIAYMLGVQPKKQKERRVPWYMSSSQSGSDSSSDRPNEFRVDADLENNRLLLWANEIEVAEVDNLLVKLGAIPAKGSDAETERTIDTGSVEEAEELLEQIRRAWPRIAPNPLQMPPAAPKRKKRETPPPEKPAEDGAAPPPRSAATQSNGSVFRLADMQREVTDEPATGGDPRDLPLDRKSAKPPARGREETPPLVKLSIDPDGKIVISSDDPEALDRLQDLAAELMPQRKEYALIHLRYVWASGVRQSLEDFFKDDNEKKPKTRRPWYWDDSDSNQNETEDDRRLSKRRKLKFISDTDTNSIIVQGADPAQLQTIKELVREFDKPAPKGSNTTDRKTESFRLRYANAKDVHDVIKDVYRDLLSSNDKALTATPGQREIQRTYIFDNEDSDSKSEQMAPKFKGLLSIGLLNSSNTLVVSAAPASLFDRVARMINDLDEAASDNTVRVVKVGRGISAARLQDVLDSVLNEGSSKGSAAAKRSSRKRPEPTAEKTGGGPSGGPRPPSEN
jgi:type II secretory pathway component GspD/PulD (secretin)